MDAFGLIELSDAARMLFYLLASLTGPNLAAFWVTGVIEGKAGMGRLFRRMFQFWVGLQWYVIVLFVFLSIWLAAYSFIYNGAPFANLVANLFVLLSIFLPNVSFGLLVPSIAEEPGWRGLRCLICKSGMDRSWPHLFSACYMGYGICLHYSHPCWVPSP
jgi:hypothetical protein